jgi:hypothetical protein
MSRFPIIVAGAAKILRSWKSLRGSERPMSIPGGISLVAAGGTPVLANLHIYICIHISYMYMNVYMIKYIYIYGQIYEVVYTQHFDVGLFENLGKVSPKWQS